MDLITFARNNGIIINENPPLNTWKRYPTFDKPRSKNGAIKNMGDYAFIQNHATQTQTITWRSNESKTSKFEMKKMIQDNNRELLDKQFQAAQKAKKMLNASTISSHPYFEKKGLDHQGYTLTIKDELLLLIPMKLNNIIVGLQIINEKGNKVFLSGQKNIGATFEISNSHASGTNYLVEGYSTGLSLSKALKSIHQTFTIHVCFSARNLEFVSKKVAKGFVIADNDRSRTGEIAAKNTGWPFWMSDVVNEDANDAHQRLGLFKFSQEILKFLRNQDGK
jgi:putative DNA primase/helicase